MYIMIGVLGIILILRFGEFYLSPSSDELDSFFYPFTRLFFEFLIFKP